MSEANPSRREFMRTAVMASMGAKSGLGLLADAPRIKFPTETRSRLAVTSWPFRALIDAPGNRARDSRQGGMDLKDFASMVAARFNVYNINPLAAHFRSTEAAYLEEFRVSTEKAGSHLVDLGLSGRSFFHPDRSRRRRAVAYGRQWIDIAISLGCPSVRQHISAVPGVKADVNLTAETLGEMAAYGAKKGIVINLENDNPASEDPFFLVAVIEKAGSPYLRGLPDFANSMQPDGNAERNYTGVDAMFKHVFNMCHVKDAMIGGGKTYPVDLDRLFAIAKRHGYRGYYSIESEDAGEPFGNTLRLVQETLKRLASG